MRSLICLTFAFLCTFSSVPDLVGQEEKKKDLSPFDYISPEVHEDGRVTFRFYAPDAEKVYVQCGDMTLPKGQLAMTKGDNGLWEGTTEPNPSGAYRYVFNVDSGIAIDPDNTQTSQSNLRVYSVVYVPGSPLFDRRDVPHGAVSEIFYHSKALDLDRRMTVYTPPGYPHDQEKYPVLYLLHGNSDSDEGWISVGRANFILDNLIADGAAKPMIIVMPDGHQGQMSPQSLKGEERHATVDRFRQELETDIRPYIEANYSVATDPAHRALAGLSMGGAQTLHAGLLNLKDYGYLGVFSSGAIGIVKFLDRPAGHDLFTYHPELLTDPPSSEHLKLFWFGIGKQDFLLSTSDKTVEVLKEAGYPVEYKITEGAHRWVVWRDYLAEFAPRLFQD